MLVLGAAAIVPTRSGDVRSHAHPTHVYSDAVARAQRIITADDSIVAEGGASILRVHGRKTPRAVVLLHGFTDSPRQFEALADSLYARGDNVFVPRLPHHAERGKNVSELSHLTATELCHVADASVDIAAGLGDSVIVLGLSVGGTMAIWTAEHRAEVKRAVVVAPALEVAHVPSVLERPLVNLGAHVPNVSRRATADSTRPDRDPGFATHGLAAVLRLGMAVRRDADHDAPPSAEVLFLVNAHDHTVKTAPVLELARTWTQRAIPVSVYEFPDSLGLPHNVVDPMQRPANEAAVYPVLRALAEGDQPPAWLGRR
ncbi:MAG TPA: alpha/beta fold hydrolase [Gemmatimonadaceae bacterium]|jgi:carboxylesterase